MTIPAPKIPQYLSADATFIQLCTESGAPYSKISLEDLQVLIANNHVIGICRGTRLKRVELIVPPDVAARALGETRAKVKDSLHCDANATTTRADESAERHRRKHKNSVCLGHNAAQVGWNGENLPTNKLPHNPTFCEQRTSQTVRDAIVSDAYLAKCKAIAADYSARDENGDYRYHVEEVWPKHHVDGRGGYQALSYVNEPHRTDRHYAPPGPNPQSRPHVRYRGPVPCTDRPAASISSAIGDGDYLRAKFSGAHPMARIDKPKAFPECEPSSLRYDVVEVVRDERIGSSLPSRAAYALRDASQTAALAQGLTLLQARYALRCA